MEFAADAVVLTLGIMVWKKHQHDVETAALVKITDECGFAALAQPAGAGPKKVWIVAAPNVPVEVVRRADERARELADRDIAFDRRAGLSFSLTEENPMLYAGIDNVMNAEASASACRKVVYCGFPTSAF